MWKNSGFWKRIESFIRDGERERSSTALVYKFILAHFVLKYVYKLHLCGL